MLEKMSVRKPFTVLVGVILVIVLGVVSIMNTPTDLLPSMDLPVSMVVTTYIGATPEQVERDVSIPMESRMSTLSGIEMVQSISAEHMSFMILMFTDDTNMDSASLEIREALDMMQLPDGVGRPMMIRLNPEMLPIMTANIHKEGVTIEELSEFARYTVTPALEGVPGVAMVSLSGLVQNQMHVVIEQARIDAVNAELAEVMGAMIEMMTAAAMAEAQAQIEATLEAAAIEMFESLYGAIVEARLEELVAEGMDPSEAFMQITTIEHPMHLHVVNQEVEAAMEVMALEIAAEMQAEMTAQADAPQEMPPMGLPAEMLTVETIHGMLFAQNFAMPAGMITEDDFDFMVRVGDRFEDADEIRNMLIFDPAAMGLMGVDPVRLSDIADIFITNDAHLTFTRVNGNPSVMFSIQRQSEFTTADIASAVRDRMEALEAEHPGLGFAVLMDQGEMIGVVIGGVLNSLLWGGLLAVIILLLFLRDIRPTLIVAVSIPVSLLLAFTLMYFTGVSLNMLSMGGLALAVGMLVDNSIVVIENIYRMRLTTDRSAARAAVSGTRQVAGAIMVASLTTISVFFPIVFTQGITRQLFTDLALTIGFSLMASLIIALTVVPAASSVMLKNMKKDHEGRLFTKFVDGYEKLLRGALRFKFPVLLVAVALFAVTFWGISQRGMELFPAMDMGQISIEATLGEYATFEEAVAAAEALSDRVLAIHDVETVGISVGGGGMMEMMAAGMGFGGMGAGGGAQGTNITMYVLTGDDRNYTHTQLLDQIQAIGDSLGLEMEADGGDMGMEMMMGEAISIRIEGRELDDIRDTAIAVADLVRTVPGTYNVTDLVEAGAHELRVVVNKDAAMAQGLTVAQVFMAVNAYITAPERSMNMTLNGRTYEIIVSDGDFTMPDRYAISAMQLSTMTGYVTLSDIAEVHEDIGFTSIARMNRNRFVNVTGELLDGYNVTLVNAEIERLLADFTPIGNTQIIMGGEAEAIAEAMGDLLLMLLLALIFIYLIMVAQFQSLLSPFIIMLTIPLAFTGGFIALLIAGMSMSIVAMIGLILLAGVSTNNGIVYISRVNQMRWEGMSKKDAIIDAGRKRIRPILMMAISTIFAMSVMAMGFGEGTEMMQPMAIAIIGGLIYATAMTLFVAPILYDLLHRDKDVTKEDLDGEEE
ncbi:MAG: efflux RND transporter permease subunit [Defluviitaleaceae bacterium]|nr:efflux RND transporter permease subunit [Defluviitaleaceae bacterium]MCL2274853.1 efflux RND transporter permease subunit [Defluviitaleaceae bacterium]